MENSNYSNYRKPFEEDLHDANDPGGREVAKWFCRAMLDASYEVLDNPDKYGVDLLIKDFLGKIVMTVEVEMRELAGWKIGQFPFNSIHIPMRKKKFASLRGSRFITINKYEPVLYVIHGKDIIASNVDTVYVDRLGELESFFDVPIEKAKFYNLEQMKGRK